MEKKFFISCHRHTSCISCFRTAAKLAKKELEKTLELKETFRKESFDILLLEINLDFPSNSFEEKLEDLDKRPAVIYSGRGEYHDKRVKKYLEEKGIGENKIILSIPCSLEEAKDAIIKLLS